VRPVSCVLVMLASLAVVGSAQAEGLAVTATFGLPLGPGVDFTYRLSPHVNLRAGGAVPAEPTVEDFKYGDIKYDLKVKVGGVNAFVDWHPTTGNFHLSGGVMTVRSPWTTTAVPVSSYTINGRSYAAADVGRLSGEVRLQNKVAPAFLVGWGNPVRPGKHWGFVIDVGVAYVGKQDFILSASGPIASDPAFRRDLAEEQRKQSDEHSVTGVAKIGVSYQF
jgi:hypothetical protein